MLPFLLVLLAAQSAWGASTLQISAYNIDELPLGVDTSNALISPWLVERTFDYLDGGDTNFLILSLVENLKDLAKVPDSRTQAIAVCDVLTLVGELATGRSGDACDYSEYINSIVGNNEVSLRNSYSSWIGRINYALDTFAALVCNRNEIRYQYINSIVGSNDSSLRTSYSNWIGRIYYALDTFAALVCNRNEIRYQSGPVGNCVGGGRTYSFEALWDKLFSTVNGSPSQVELLNEQYCMALRLKNAWNIRSNVVASAVSSCATPKSIALFQKVLAPLSNVLRTAANNGDVVQAVAQAKAQIAAVC